MEPEGWSSCSHLPTTGPYPEQAESDFIFTSYFCEISFNIIFPSTLMSFMRCVSFRLSISNLSNSCYMFSNFILQFILTIFSAVCKLWRSLLRSYLQLPLTSSLLGCRRSVFLRKSRPLISSSDLLVRWNRGKKLTTQCHESEFYHKKCGIWSVLIL